MTAAAPQAISGVNPSSENLIMTVYPSIAANGIGRLLGSLYDSIPIRIVGMRLSRLLFTLPTAPVGVLIYLLQKVTGAKYTLTTRGVQVWASLGKQRRANVAFEDFESIEVEQRSGQAFFRAADLHLRDSAGKIVLTLHGVQHADSFRSAILRAKSARHQVAESLATISARAV